MTLLKFGHTIVNADRIAFVSRTDITGLEGGFTTIGASIHFDGGAMVEIKDPKAMDAFEKWAKESGHHVKIVL